MKGPSLSEVVLGITFSAPLLGPAGNNTAVSVAFLDQETGGVLASWDGRNASGERVPPGQYQVVVKSSEAGEGPVVVTALLSVLPFPTAGLALSISPNPALDQATFNVGSIQGADWVLRVYTVSAELVWKLDIPGPNSSVTWDLKGSDGRKVAAGLYFVLAEPRGGGLAERATGRLVVLR